MRVFNENKTKELQEYDLEHGYLREDKLFIMHHEAVAAVEGQYHKEIIREYPKTGGKDVRTVCDVEPIPAQPAYDEYEDIQVYVPFTEEEKKEQLRAKRERICYPVVNRGQLWYKRLTSEQKSELDEWYQAWLDVTETMAIPQKPLWLK